jgi:hypothetical protein
MTHGRRKLVRDRERVVTAMVAPAVVVFLVPGVLER